MKMYIPIVNETKDIVKFDSEGKPVYNKTVTLLSANKIRRLVEYIPCEEVLKIHLEMEKLKIEKDKDYRPKPLYISLESSIFNDIISEIEGKNPKAPKDHIPLVFQYPAIPVCIIQSK